MAVTVEVIAMGDSLGILLPPEIVNRLLVKEGDTLFLTNAPDGVRLTRCTPDLAKKLDVMEQIMHEHRDTLKRLAE